MTTGTDTMQFWTLWKHGPDREPNGALVAHLVACSDSFEALARRGAQLAAQFGRGSPAAMNWLESPRGARRYQLGSEDHGAYLVIEPDIAPEVDWQPLVRTRPPAASDWLDEDAHSLR
jgi:hypothetical protein